jgi:hypothetical protein
VGSNSSRGRRGIEREHLQAGTIRPILIPEGSHGRGKTRGIEGEDLNRDAQTALVGVLGRLFLQLVFGLALAEDAECLNLEVQIAVEKSDDLLLGGERVAVGVVELDHILLPPISFT